jgi:hypothetical protein
MKLISPFLALFLLVSCAGFLLADKTKIQIQITTSKDKLINIVTNDEGFKALSDKIVAEIQQRLLRRGIVSSTHEINDGEKVKLAIEYEYLENDTMPIPAFPILRKNIYVMKGKVNLIDPKTQKVLLNVPFDEVEDKISDLVNSVSKKISKKVIGYIK